MKRLMRVICSENRVRQFRHCVNLATCFYTNYDKILWNYHYRWGSSLAEMSVCSPWLHVHGCIFMQRHRSPVEGNGYLETETKLKEARRIESCGKISWDPSELLLQKEGGSGINEAMDHACAVKWRFRKNHTALENSSSKNSPEYNSEWNHSTSLGPWQKLKNIDWWPLSRKIKTVSEWTISPLLP